MTSAAPKPIDPPPGYRACRACGVHFDTRLRNELGGVHNIDTSLNCELHRSMRTPLAVGLDAVTRYEDDEQAQAFVAAHPDGATLEEIGELWGITRERVRQIERAALHQLRARLKLAGVSERDIRDYFASKAGSGS